MKNKDYYCLFCRNDDVLWISKSDDYIEGFCYNCNKITDLKSKWLVLPGFMADLLTNTNKDKKINKNKLLLLLKRVK